MGFGIALFGLAFMLMGEFGGGVLAAPLLAYGFFLASRSEMNFLRASISSLFLLPRGIYKLIFLFLPQSDSALVSALDLASFVVYQLAWLLMVYFWLTAVINIARDSDAQKFENKAKRVLVITSAYILLSVAATVLNTAGILGNAAFTVSSLMFIFMYVILIYDILMMHNCFVLITTEKQYAKDKQKLAQERAEALEQMHQTKQEALKKLEKRNKK